MIQEFKDFINRGSVIDLAVAVVLGAAFAPVVSAVVDRFLMPIIGMIVGQPNFDTVGTFACEPAAEGLDGIVVGSEICAGSVGAIVTAIINFVLVGLALFLVVKAYNAMQQPEEERTQDEPAEDIVILREIRDELARANDVTVSSPQRTTET